MIGLRPTLALLADLLAALTVATASDAAEPIARIVMPPGAPYMAGKQIEMEVQVLVPNFFMAPPRFPVLDIPGTVVALSDDRALNFTETIEGVGYSGIRRIYFVVPIQEGRFVVPPTPIPFAYAAVPGQATQASVALPRTTFETILPPGAYGPDGPRALVPLEIVQAWEPAPENLKIGDAVTRTITVTAKGMQAMLIPPPKMPVPDGAKAYPHDPVLSTIVTGGKDVSGGRRVDRVSYQFTRAGGYDFLPVRMEWFDVGTGSVRAEETAALHVNVAATSSATAIAPEAIARHRDFGWVSSASLMSVAGIALGAVFLTYIRYLPRIASWNTARRLAYLNSEPGLFAQFEASCRTDDKLAVYQSMWRWARAAGIRSLTSWAAQSETSGLPDELKRLDEHLFSGQPIASLWHADPLARSLAQARLKLLTNKKTLSPEALPPLNPDWPTENSQIPT